MIDGGDVQRAMRPGPFARQHQQRGRIRSAGDRKTQPAFLSRHDVERAEDAVAEGGSRPVVEDLS
jgi:hypothetical protein